MDATPRPEGAARPRPAMSTPLRLACAPEAVDPAIPGPEIPITNIVALNPAVVGQAVDGIRPARDGTQDGTRSGYLP
ncbi:hypothetical protein GCM10010182_81890 [Actinomadura cremea]|nr:hypothetical protein GCM10010182_81890 [Actinomadura cremea]